jgi:hypothetical protein
MLSTYADKVAYAVNVAYDLDVPKDYVKAVMTKAASGVRRLLNFVYNVEITVSIPATEVAEIADKNDGIKQLSDPTNSGTVEDTFASALSSIPEFTSANGGVEVGRGRIS